MIFATFAFWAALGTVGINGPYEVRFVAYDSFGHPLYMRPAWVFIGSPEALGERPLPTDNPRIQDVDISIRLTTAPETAFCTFPQTATTEIGRVVTWGCEEAQ